MFVRAVGDIIKGILLNPRKVKNESMTLENIICKYLRTIFWQIEQKKSLS